jgi:uncharacterized membrane protein HdeD (DUF308 family)
MNGPTTAEVAALRGGWGWVLAIGILTLLAGIAMLGAPVFTTVAAAIFAGWLLLILGVAGIVIGIRSRRTTGRTWDITMGVLSIAAGLYLLLFPLSGALALTLAVALWLGVRGTLWLAAAFRGGSGGYRALTGVTGVIDLGLAVLLFVGFPYPALGFIGIAIGVSLIFGGVSTIIAALALRRLA